MNKRNMMVGHGRWGVFPHVKMTWYKMPHYMTLAFMHGKVEQANGLKNLILEGYFESPAIPLTL